MKSHYSNRQGKETANSSNPANPRFSLKALFWLMTVVAVCLSIPGGELLLSFVGGWFPVAVLILGVLALIQAPIWFVVMKSVRSKTSSKDRSGAATPCRTTSAATR